MRINKTKKIKFKRINKTKKTKKKVKNIVKFKNNDYIVLKELNKDIFGTTFLVKNNKTNYAFKIQKILEDNIKQNTGINLWRELEFNKHFIKKMDNKDKYFFMEISDYEILNSCDHIHERNGINFDSKKPDNKVDKIIYKYSKQQPCVYYLMEYISGSTVYEYFINLLKNNKNILDKVLFNISLQFIKSIQLLSLKGYGHNNEHPTNMMLTTIPKKYNTFTLNGKTIHKYKYQFKLINYGTLNNKKYIQRQNASLYNYMFLKNPNDYYYCHCLYALIDLFYNRANYIYAINNKKNIIGLVKYDLKGYTYKKIMTQHTSFFNKTFNKLIKQYPNTEKYMLELNKYVKNTNIKKIELFEYIKNLFNDKYKTKKHIYGFIEIVINKLLYTFQIMYPELYLKYNGYDIIDKRMVNYQINKEIGLQLIEFTTMDEIINYLTNYYLNIYKK